MKYKFQLIAIAVALAVFTVAVGRVGAQHSHEHGSNAEWKKGMVRLNEPTFAGSVRLKSGMYHVVHVVEGDKHWLVFTEVSLGAGYKEGSMYEGKEVARVECRLEPAQKPVSNTKVVLNRTSGSTSSIEQVQIAGEKVRHVLFVNSAAG